MAPVESAPRGSAISHGQLNAVRLDDDAEVWVNGSQVFSDHNGVANLLPYLTVGDNLVAFVVTDNFSAHGYNHAAWLQIDGQIAAVPEPQRPR